MSMLSDDLQKALDAAFLAARGENHDLLTVEHLLLALLGDANVTEVLNGAGADLDGLEQALRTYIKNNVQIVVFPTRGQESRIQRLLQVIAQHAHACSIRVSSGCWWRRA